MSFTWTECHTLKLVILYSRHECLWNPFHPEFKNKLSRYKAYKNIAESMCNRFLTVCDCIKRITQIKAQYCYELSKISAAISCEKTYKPKVNWFPIIHEILFPFVKTYGYRNGSWKVHNEETSLHKDYHNSEVTGQLKNSNMIELRRTQRHCNCPYTNSDCSKFHRTLPGTSSRKNWTEMERDKRTNYSHLQVTRINTGCNTGSCITTDSEIQTDLSSFKTACRSCQTCTTDDLSAKKNSEDVDEIHKGKRTFCDEFDVFGKSIACQLRNINFDAAINLERRIQDLIVKERLGTMKFISHSFNAACYNSSCSECNVMRNEAVCTCGLPLIKIQADASCGFCK